MEMLLFLFRVALQLHTPIFHELEECTVVVDGLPHHRLPRFALALVVLIPVLASAAPSLHIQSIAYIFIYPSFNPVFLVIF